jgi:DNA-directed RNA polymerase specialized sigma24 family protein
MKVIQPDSLSKFTELDLIVQDKIALSIFVARAFRFLNDKQLAREAVQSVLVTLYVDADIGQIRDYRRYILTCVTNHCKKILRQRKKLNLTDDIENIISEEPTRLYKAIELFPVLMQLLEQRMTKRQFRALELWINLYSEKDIAEELGISVTAASTLLCNAKKNARKIANAVADLLDN